MTAAALARAALEPLWPTLRGFLLRIGRWLLETILDATARGLVIYMQQRIKVFCRRLERTRSKRRQTWLRGRIARWARAAKWFEQKADALEERITKAAMARAEAEVPDEAPDFEDFARWSRAERRRKARERRQERRKKRRS